VQVVRAPAAAGRRLRISGWSRAVGVRGARSDGYALACDLQLADGG
jgi:hypothetical protein